MTLSLAFLEPGSLAMPFCNMPTSLSTTNRYQVPPISAAGFTLAELAIVLLIVGLLLAGILTPLSSQIETQRYAQTQKTLDDIKEAIVGFAVLNGRLPRPAQSATNGDERVATCVNDAECTGFIPWQALGVTKLDAWGKIIRYSVTPAFANATFTLSTPASKSVQTRDPNPPFGLIGLANAVPEVIYSSGKRSWGTNDSGNPLADESTTNVDEDTNNSATTTFISRIKIENTTALGGEFDDIVIWLPSTVLMARMVAAGRLP